MLCFILYGSGLLYLSILLLLLLVTMAAGNFKSHYSIAILLLISLPTGVLLSLSITVNLHRYNDYAVDLSTFTTNYCQISNRSQYCNFGSLLLILGR